MTTQTTTTTAIDTTTTTLPRNETAMTLTTAIDHCPAIANDVTDPDPRECPRSDPPRALREPLEPEDRLEYAEEQLNRLHSTASSDPLSAERRAELVGCLGRLSPADRATIARRYDRRVLSPVLADRLHLSTALVVGIHAGVITLTSGFEALERASVKTLEELVRTGRTRRLDRLQRRAGDRFDRAVEAFAALAVPRRHSRLTTTPSHRSDAMPAAALALESTVPIDTLTLVHDAPAPANSNAAPPERARRGVGGVEELPLLRPSQVHHVAAEEIAFYFATDHAEGGDDDADPDVAAARAVIESRIAELDPRDQEALALYYDPEPWPESILEEGLDYQSGYALVLSRASASRWRARGTRRYTDEQAASEQLRAAVFDHGPRALRHLARRAEWDFATALRAYEKARGRAPSALAGLDRAPDVHASYASNGSEGSCRL